jgi:RNA polymerase sigma-70 factor (ECF subfamily)
MMAAMAPEPLPAAVSGGAAMIEQIAGGSHEAMAELYDLMSGRVYGLALRIVRNPAVAEEVTLDVFMQIWRTAAQYSAARGSVQAWLATMARARALDWLRSAQGRAARDSSPIEEMAPLRISAPDPEEAAIDASRTALVRKHLNALPAEQSQLIEMSFFSGFSHSEIAEKLGLPLGTVKSRIRQGMCHLRDCFQAEALFSQSMGTN